MLLPDEGSRLVKGCSEMKLNFYFYFYKHQLHHDIAVDFDVCPVGGHHMHGTVERKIREMKSSLERSMSNERVNTCFEIST